MKESLVVFDLDDTLVSTGARVRVTGPVRLDGTPRRYPGMYWLTPDEYAGHEKMPGEKFNYHEMSDGNLFCQTAKELPLMATARTVSWRNDTDTIIMTSRPSMSQQPPVVKFLQNNFKLNISDHAFYTCGDVPGNDGPRAKYLVLREYLTRRNFYSEVHVYDDSLQNLARMAQIRYDMRSGRLGGMRTSFYLVGKKRALPLPLDEICRCRWAAVAAHRSPPT